MTTDAYLISWTDFVENVEVLRFESATDAETWCAERLGGDRSALVATSADDFGTNLTHSAAVLVRLYNALGPDKPVQRFESRETGAKRTFALLDARHRGDPVPQETTVEDITEVAIDDKAAAKAVKARERAAAKAAKAAARAAAPPKAPGGRAAAGQDPVPERFKPVREGTFRAALLRAMDGTRTAEEIGAEYGRPAALVLSHAFCLTRDCGIGYSVRDGRLGVVFPDGKGLSDAIAQPKAA